MQEDLHRLARFVTAQADNLNDVMSELRAGRKRTHWMWFVFPQMRGLGHSSMATTFGIGSLDEARAYLEHPVLGPRLLSCTELVLAQSGTSLNDIFGSPDDMKFRSCMTLFALASPLQANLFQRALDIFCGGTLDPATLALLQRDA